MEWEEVAGIVIAWISFLLIPFAAIYYLRKEHSQEIYLIWYIACLFCFLFIGIGIVAERQNIHRVEVCGTYVDTCKTVLHYLTNVRDELIFIGAAAALAIVPQLLTYFLSGLSGSASAPKFMWHVEKFAIWSFIKFMAILGGIVLADPIVQLFAGKSVGRLDFAAALIFIGAAFVFAAAEIWLTEALPKFWRRHRDSQRLLFSIHRFLTRNASKE